MHGAQTVSFLRPHAVEVNSSHCPSHSGTLLGSEALQMLQSLHWASIRASQSAVIHCVSMHVEQPEQTVSLPATGRFPSPPQMPFSQSRLSHSVTSQA